MESKRSANDRARTIGIIGAGHIGQALARTALRAGRKVVISNSRGPESLDPLVATLGTGVSAGTVGEAAASEIVAIGVPWTSVPAAVTDLQWELGADPHQAGGRRVIFLSGDDALAKAAVVELFDAAGFFTIDLGDLVTGGRMQQLGGPLSSHDLVRLPPVG
jgi:hypothetical protein